MRPLFTFLTLLLLPLSLWAQTANLQIIHNSPSPTVDIWVNDQPLLTGIEYRTATPYLEVPAGTPLEIGVAPSPSTDTSDIIARFNVNFEPNSTNVAIATGIVGDATTPFDLALNTMARDTAISDNVEFFAYHGSTDAPAVDVIARDVATLADDFAYGDITPYIEVPAGEYILDVTPAGNNEVIVASFGADLSGLDGQSAVVFASGFLAPEMGDPAFGLFAALADGTVVALPSVENTAQLQIIHNSPSPTVDIWVNNQPLLTDVEFRTATPYLEVPAGTPLEIGVAPSPSTDTSDIIARFNVNFSPNSTNVAIATGIVGDPSTPFNLALNTMARDTAISNNVEFFAYHGATDAPAVDVIARNVATLLDDFAFGDISPYIEVPADNYILDVTPANDNDVIVASFEADLSGLGGQSAVVFASGFLSPGMGDPAFGLFAALADGTVVTLPSVTNTAQLQIIHNSPSPTVDIWVNDQPLLTDVEYRTATPYLEVPAGTPLEIGVAPSPSTDTSDIIARFNVNFEPNSTNVAIATGIVGDATTPFDLALNTMARDTAISENVEFFAYHGSTDAPAVDVVARDVATLLDSFAFGDITPYIEVPEGSYILDVTPAGNNEVIVASFGADLTGLDGQSAVVFASGFLAPGAGDPLFGLFVALADGTVVELPVVQNLARLQLIHNSPSPTVDIWLGNQKFLENFEYRTSTPSIELPAGAIYEFGVAPAPSDDTSDIIARFQVVLEPNTTNVAFASGIVGDPNTPFTLDLNSSPIDTSTSDQFRFIAYHGATDAPTVDVVARDVATLVDNVSFGEFSSYLEVPASEYILDVTPGDDNSEIVASYEANLTGLEGVEAVVFASGFLNPQEAGDPAFGLYVAFQDGVVLPLPEVENTAQLQIIHNSPSPTVDIWVNGQPYETDFEFLSATEYREVPAGQTLQVGIAPSPSNSVNDTIVNFEINLTPGEVYQAIAFGVVGNANTPFNLAILNPARLTADDAGIDLTVFHGSPDAPNVDIFARDITQLFSDVAYGSFTDYLNVPTADYIIDIKQTGTSPNVASFNAPLSSSGLDSVALTVMASGFLNPPSNDDPGFGLYAVLADGTVIPLPIVTNTIDPAIQNGSISMFPVPARDQVDINFTLTESRNVQLDIIDLRGSSVVSQNIGRLNTGSFNEKLNISQLPAGTYFLRIVSDKGVTSKMFNKN